MRASRLVIVGLLLVAWALPGLPAEASVRPKPVLRGPGRGVPSLEEATRNWKRLSSDRRSKGDAMAWNRAVNDLERVSRSSRGNTAVVAMTRAAAAAEEWARLSRGPADAREAVRLYRGVLALNPSAAQRAEATSAAGRVERELVRGAKASAVRHEPSRPPERPVSAPAAAPKSEPSLTKAERQRLAADAREAAAQLQKVVRQGKSASARRSEWLKPMARLERAALSLSPSPDGAEALWSASEGARELAGHSRREDDVRRACELYLRLANDFPASGHVDDAFIAVAHLERTELHETAMARRHLQQAVAAGGDKAGQARELLKALGGPLREEPKPAARPIAKATREPAVAPSEKPVEKAPKEARDDRPSKSKPETRLVQTEPKVDAGKAPDRSEHPTDVDSVKAIQRRALAETEWSLSEQMGLKVRRIVIDAGHGGHDTGAIGPTGVREKDVTLGVAKELASQLRSRGYDVVLTRDGDRYLALEERTRLANQHRGDLFISIHANAHRSPSQSGVETYSLNLASDRYAKRLAARENATAESSASELQYMLADLATRANTVDSARLARIVQQSIVQGVAKKFGKPKDHGVKHALFFVLLGAKMPAILVETAFLSNPAEEKKLAGSPYRAALARSIADGVEKFVARRQELAAVDQ